MSVVLYATDLSCDTIDIDLVQDFGQFFAFVRTSYAKILTFSSVKKSDLVI